MQAKDLFNGQRFHCGGDANYRIVKAVFPLHQLGKEHVFAVDDAGNLHIVHGDNSVEPLEAKHTYAVWATDVDRRYLLGHASGDIADIEAYYDDRKAYGLNVEQVQAVNVPRGYAVKRAGLLAEKQRLEAALAELNKQLA